MSRICLLHHGEASLQHFSAMALHTNMQVWLSPALRNTGLRSFNDVTRIFPCFIMRTNL